MRIPALVVLVLLLIASVAAAQTIYFQPFRLLVYSLLDTSPEQSRYGVALIDDRQTPGLCLAVITDTVTGQFTAASVPAEACETRRFE